METNTPSPSPQPDPSPTTTAATKPSPAAAKSKNRDFLTHLETYLAKRDGVDKLLKISRYAAKLILSTSPSLSPSHPLTARLKSFESSVGLSRKAFRLGKFIADVNALRATVSTTADPTTLLLSTIAYGGEGLYYFIEQIVWLSKTGLIDARHARDLQKVSAWAELAGYVGSVGLKLRDLRILGEEKTCVESSKDVAAARGGGEVEKLRRKESAVRLKIAMKRVSIVQDLADGLMALGDIRDGKGAVFSPGVLACAGMVSALISTHKNWVSG